MTFCAMPKTITLIIPCFNEAASLPSLYIALNELATNNQKFYWEFLFIDDGSQDETMDILRSLAEKDSRLSYVELSRNFGKENAMLAGFDYASGDCAVVIDADLQHPPEVIPKMIEKWESGYEDVYGKRLSRGREAWWRRCLSIFFYKALQRSVRYDILPNVGDFRLLDRKIIDVLRNLRETERYTKGMFAWVGFKKAFVEFETRERIGGTSHMGLRSLTRLAMCGITSCTTSPLKWPLFLGEGICLAAFAILFLVPKIIEWIQTEYLMIFLFVTLLFLDGLLFIALGVLGGEYLARIFVEVKQRPVYVVRNLHTKK